MKLVTIKVIFKPEITLESIVPPTESVVIIVKPVRGIPEYGLIKLSTLKINTLPLSAFVIKGLVIVRIWTF